MPGLITDPGRRALTVVILVPGIVLAIIGQTEVQTEIGALLAVITMAIFVHSVPRKGVGVPAGGNSNLFNRR